MKAKIVNETTEDKVWVTVSMTQNLGDYENVKVDSGYSRTINKGENPIELMENMQDEIGFTVKSYIKNFKKEAKNELRKRRTN